MSQARWHRSVVCLLWRLRQGVCRFKVYLDYKGEFKTSLGSLVEASSQNRKTDRKRSREIEKVKGWLGEGVSVVVGVLSQRV